MEIALIGERHTVHGFRLAGIRRAALIDEARKGDMRALLRELFSGEVALLRFRIAGDPWPRDPTLFEH